MSHNEAIICIFSEIFFNFFCYFLFLMKFYLFHLCVSSFKVPHSFFTLLKDKKRPGKFYNN